MLKTLRNTRNSKVNSNFWKKNIGLWIKPQISSKAFAVDGPFNASPFAQLNMLSVTVSGAGALHRTNTTWKTWTCAVPCTKHHSCRYVYNCNSFNWCNRTGNQWCSPICNCQLASSVASSWLFAKHADRLLSPRKYRRFMICQRGAARSLGLIRSMIRLNSV